MEPEHAGRWQRQYEKAYRDYERRARRLNPRLAKLAPPGDIELPLDTDMIRSQAATHANQYVELYCDLVDGGYWCNVDRDADFSDL